MSGVTAGTRHTHRAGRAESRHGRPPRWVWIFCLCLLAGTGCRQIPTFRGQSPAEKAVETETLQRALSEPIAGVRVEGNRVIPEDAVLAVIRSRAGQVVSEQQVREDMQALLEKRWFYWVDRSYEMTDDGVVLVFKVSEKPLNETVEYRGNEHISDKALARVTDLKEGQAFDVSANRLALRRIEDHYREKGYPFAKVTLLEGDNRDDRSVIFEIEEGHKQIVDSTTFTGNEFVSDAVLRTKLLTKRSVLGITLFGGKFNPATLQDDIAALKQYYESMGFFDVEIDYDVYTHQAGYIPWARHADFVTVEYKINEGMRYSVGNITFEGNSVFTEQELRSELTLHESEAFFGRRLLRDVDTIQTRYGEQGRLFSQVDVERRFQEQPGVVDLIYKIKEDNINRVRLVNVHVLGDYPHTKETVVRNTVLVAPGDLADPKMIDRSKRRLENVIFERGPQLGPRIQVSKVPKETPAVAQNVFRGQSPYPPFNGSPNPVFENSPQGDPFSRALRDPDRGYDEVDLDIFVNEARTGRLQFGVGVNSDAGVVGSIVLEENNFDLLRPPASFHDIVNGTAWRGGGQRFRIEAIPGDIVSRYMVNWTDPYFMDTDYSLGVSGFYFNRFYPDWDEDRVGGRFSLGRQLTREWSINGTFRLEEVTLRNPDQPTPPIVQMVVGDNLLTTFRGTIAHDTRDTSFLPAEGHMIQVSAEQAIGDFSYSRVEGEASQYFTVWRRPDDSGRHIVSLHGQLGWTGDDTPVFERFYAGGFQSFRGFAFRGVSPKEGAVRVGGRWLAIGSVEYQAPLTADENIHAVVFSDFGTVESDVGMDDFRVSVGAGLRLLIPAMGPAPIALDWAVPLADQEDDDTRVFSFYIGLSR